MAKPLIFIPMLCCRCHSFIMQCVVLFRYWLILLNVECLVPEVHVLKEENIPEVKCIVGIPGVNINGIYSAFTRVIIHRPCLPSEKGYCDCQHQILMPLMPHEERDSLSTKISEPQESNPHHWLDIDVQNNVQIVTSMRAHSLLWPSGQCLIHWLTGGA